LTDQPVVLRGTPHLADISNMGKLLARLGVDVNVTEPAADQPGAMALHTRDTSTSHAPYDIVRTMRASVCVLGPMLARRGSARLSTPGGAAVGARPAALPLRGLEALGARITLDSGDIIARTPPSGRLKGARIFLGGAFGPTVLGTANVM